MPLCFAYREYLVTSRLAQEANKTYRCQLILGQAPHKTYREYNKEDILSNVAPTLVSDPHGCGPRSPVRAFGIGVCLPTAERPIEIELAPILDITADSSLYVS